MQSKKKLAQLFKKTGRLNEAVQIWQELAVYTPADFYVVSELAKWLEHRVQDYSQAKILIDKALNQDNIFSEDEKKSLLHRLKRLNSKLVTTR
jgi:tetratricopeptide (TPR) repeat protein